MTKIQQIFLDFAELPYDSEAAESMVSSQEFQSLKSDLNGRLDQIFTMISDLKSTSRLLNSHSQDSNTSIIAVLQELAANRDSAVNTVVNSQQSIRSEQSTSTIAVLEEFAANLTENSALNLTSNTEKQTYAQVLRNQGLEKLISIKNNQDSWNLVEKKKGYSARSKSGPQHSGLNKNANSQSNSNSSFSYRERRLILLNSKNFALTAADSIKLRDKINKEFQKQLKLSANKPVLATISKLYKQQNLVLTTIADYNADYLIQHENIWQKEFKYTEYIKDKVWYKIITYNIPTEIFDFSEGLDLLKQEIKIFNGIELIAVN